MGLSDNLPVLAFAVGAAAIIVAQRYIASSGAPRAAPTRFSLPPTAPDQAYGPHTAPAAAAAGKPKAKRTLDELPKFSADDVAEGHRPARRVSVAGESLSPEDLTASKRVVHPKADEVKARLAKMTAKLLLFRSLDAAQIGGTFPLARPHAPCADLTHACTCAVGRALQRLWTRCCSHRWRLGRVSSRRGSKATISTWSSPARLRCW
jgi:hypothetical protein